MCIRFVGGKDWFRNYGVENLLSLAQKFEHIIFVTFTHIVGSCRLKKFAGFTNRSLLIVPQNFDCSRVAQILAQLSYIYIYMGVDDSVERRQLVGHS